MHSTTIEKLEELEAQGEGMNQKVQEVQNEKTDLYKQFQLNRMRGFRQLMLLCVISNFISQIIDLLNPLSDRQRNVNIVYMGVSLLSFGGLFLSFKKENNIWIAVINSTAVAFRFIARLLDFEQTRYLESESDSESRMSIEKWGYMVALHAAYVCLIYISRFHSLIHSKGILIFTAFEIIPVSLAFTQAFTQENFHFLEVTMWIKAFLAVCVIMMTLRNSSKQIFESMDLASQKVNQFKIIFDNLDTPVIIYSDSKAAYCNDSFIKRFKPIIKKASSI
jgi:hypothetical protein